MTSLADKPTIVGDRVVLRPMVADDAVAMHAATQDEEGTRLTGTRATFDLATIQRWCATRAEQADRLDLSVVDRATGEWAGEVVVNEWDPDNCSANFRIAIAPGMRDGGRGREATHLLLDHVLGVVDDPPVHRLSLSVLATNPRAIAVYEAGGFVREGVLRQSLRWDGAWIDTIVMAILREEWRTSQG